MTPIRIGYVIDELNVGGTEKQLVETIRRLDRNKFTPYLICLRTTKYFNEVDVGCRKQVLMVNSLASTSGVIKLVKFASFLRKKQVDIVQTFFFDSTVFGVIAGKIGRVKKIVVSRRDLGFWYTPGLLRVLRFTNLFVDRFLVNSQAVKANLAKLEKIPLQKIDVIYNGIEKPLELPEDLLSKLKAQLGISPSDWVVGIVANLNRPVKRVDLFLQAAALVSQKVKNVKFVIVGDGYLRKDLEQLSRYLHINDKVIFVGRQENVWPYVSILDVGVLCSDSEGFSNSLLEYSAMGVPAVATNIEGNKEIAGLLGGKAIRLVSRGNADALAHTISGMLNDYDSAVAEAGVGKQELMKRFSWKTIAEKVNAYYRAMLIIG